jgi:hypothetical protein
VSIVHDLSCPRPNDSALDVGALSYTRVSEARKYSFSSVLDRWVVVVPIFKECFRFHLLLSPSYSPLFPIEGRHTYKICIILH